MALTGGTAGAASSVETRSYDAALGVAVDGSGDAFLIGSTTTPNFPITGTAFQATNRGQADAFVAEIGAGLTGTASLLSSSYLGGSNADYGNAIALDSVGNAYITGKTTSTDFTTLTPYSATNVAGGAYDSFVSRVGTALPRGTIGTVAGVGGAYGYGGDGGRATAAQLSYPIGEPAVDAAGDVFFADTSNERVREVIAASGSITTVVDSGGAGGFGGDGGPASAALVSAPEGVTLDAAGNLYIADTYNSRVREVRAVGGVVGPSSTIVTVAGGGNPADGVGDGEPTRQTDADGNTTTSLYDPLGRMVTQTNPLSGTAVMTYTATELTQQRDAQGNVTSYGYDNAGRQTLVSNPVTGTMRSGYDAAGNTVAMTTTDATAGGAVTTLESMGYDSFNRVTSDTVVTDTSRGLAGPTLTTLTAYDRDGNVAQVQQPTGDMTANAYDLADEPSLALLAAAPVAPGQPATTLSYESYGYDGAGNLASLTDADGRGTATTYDGDNRVLQSVATSSDDRGTTTITSVPQYDPNGNQTGTTTTTQQPTGGTETHTTGSTYDTNDTLVASGNDGLRTAYGHDPSGDARVETILVCPLRCRGTQHVRAQVGL